MKADEKVLDDFDQDTRRNVQEWLNGNYDQESKSEVQRLLREAPEKLVDAFYKKLDFGTGGLRGIMGVGTNRINGYTLQCATQGLCRYLDKVCSLEGMRQVVIGFDSRNHSKEFAEMCASVIAANGFTALLFENLRPTPLISFACRHYHCLAAIMITASHNPPEYNGYKVYWSDGAQVLPPHDQGIIDAVHQISDLNMIKTVETLNHPNIQYIGEELDEAYLRAISKLQLKPQEDKKEGENLRVVYTSIHGTGSTIVCKALKRWGFSSVSSVKEQEKPNGDFPTVHSPNPEEHEALRIGAEQMIRENGDLLIGTDPDTDRVGIALIHQGTVHFLNGNQVACLCLDYICRALQEKNRMPKNAAFIKTVVTTEMFQKICDDYGVSCFNVLTGFKHIAELIRKWEDNNKPYEFVFAAEESYGYLLGDLTRDKDAITAAALICEVALEAKKRNETLIDYLHKLYRKHGVYVEQLTSITFPDTKESQERMKESIEHLRLQPPEDIGGVKVKTIADFTSSTLKDLSLCVEKPLNQAKAPLIAFYLQDESRIMIRPSGTEAKIKVYSSVKKNVLDSVNDSFLIAEHHCRRLKDDIEKILR